LFFLLSGIRYLKQHEISAKEGPDMSAEPLEAILEGRRSQPQQLVEVLQDVQDACGYISQEAMKVVAEELGVPIIEVYRVARFYKAFSLKPEGEHVITVCTGTACHVRGSDLLIDQVKGQLKVEPGNTTEDGLFTLKCVNCLGACALAPVVVKNGTYHDYMTPGAIRKMIDTARGKKKKEEREVTHAKAK
jgi:NADH:ubiquinone oxidoreductase subunit E